MKSTPPSLELIPMDQPSVDPPAPRDPEDIEIVPLDRVRPVVAAPEDKSDRFAREAAQQYAEGHIDQPLWDRAFAQANGDRLAASQIYLRARATALRLLDREHRQEQRPMVATMTAKVALPPVDDAADIDEDAPVDLGGTRGFARYRIAIVAAAVFVALAVGGWLFASLRNADDVPATVAAAPPPVPRVPAVGAPSAARPPAAAADAKAGSAAVIAAQPAATPEFMKKIQELRDAGNWNVLVLYVVEWTRREPANPIAWDQLRAGYVTLRQFDDALGAANHAIQLAPRDPRMWRNLGEINENLDDPTGALSAFEKAASLDPADVDSLRHVGLLEARLGHAQESKLAFDRALVVSPGDATALCMRTSVAQLPVMARDAYTTARQIKAVDVKCRGAVDPVATSVK